MHFAEAHVSLSLVSKSIIHNHVCALKGKHDRSSSHKFIRHTSSRTNFIYYILPEIFLLYSLQGLLCVDWLLSVSVVTALPINSLCNVISGTVALQYLQSLGLSTGSASQHIYMTAVRFGLAAPQISALQHKNLWSCNEPSVVRFAPWTLVFT